MTVIKVLVSIILMSVVLGAGYGVASFMAGTPRTADQKSSPLPPPMVGTVRIDRETVTEQIVGYGTARAFQTATLAAEVSGQIVEVGQGLEDGSPIRAGQLVVRIDERRYEQTLAQRRAMAQAELARIQQVEVRAHNLQRLLHISEREVKVNLDEERRVADLFEKELASRKEFDFARLAYQRSLRELTSYQNELDLIEPEKLRLGAAHLGRLAEVEVAALDLEHCRIMAPFDGQIDELLVEVGEQVQRGTRVARVVNPTLIELPIELPISAYTRLGPGSEVLLSSDSTPDLSWSGQIDRVSPGADQQSRTFRAYVAVDNREQSTPLIPGAFLRAQVKGETLENVLLVPRGAIVDEHVFVVQQDQAKRKEVRVVRFIAERAVVTGEVGPGDRIITTNLDMLEDGMAVRLREPVASAGGL